MHFCNLWFINITVQGNAKLQSRQLHVRVIHQPCAVGYMFNFNVKCAFGLNFNRQLLQEHVFLLFFTDIKKQVHKDKPVPLSTDKQVIVRLNDFNIVIQHVQIYGHIHNFKSISPLIAEHLQFKKVQLEHPLSVHNRDHCSIKSCIHNNIYITACTRGDPEVRRLLL